LKPIAPNVMGLLLSVYEDSEQLFKSTPGGAGSYMLRRTSPTQILAPIAAAWEKGVFTREEIAESVRHYFEAAVVSLPVGGSAHELVNLTPREHEILGLLSKGHPDKEIAEILRISTWTVHGHLKKIFEKLHAHNRTDAVVKYLHK
jgi:DNA-binding NarL/FixJ family response regulator